MREIPFYLFVLMLVLIALAYYTGLKSDSQAIFAGINQIGQTFTGRNSQNQFAGYPK